MLFNIQGEKVSTVQQVILKTGTTATELINFLFDSHKNDTASTTKTIVKVRIRNAAFHCKHRLEFSEKSIVQSEKCLTK